MSSLFRKYFSFFFFFFYVVLCCPLQDKNTISFYSISLFLFSLTKISSDKQFQ